MANYINDCYILQTEDNNLWYFFYTPDKNISYSLYSNKHWSNPIIIFRNTSSHFSVNFTEKKEIYLFCQDINYNVILCTYKNKKWSSDIILKNTSADSHELKFQAITYNNSLHLIYAVPDKLKQHQLFYQLYENGGWTASEKIDIVTPFERNTFELQKINDKHFILFYAQSDNIIGYRELLLSNKRWSDFHIISNTRLSFLDQSFLTTQTHIHSLYIVKTNHSLQLIYRQKEDTDWNNPILIFDSPKIEQCSIFIIDKQIWATWYMSSQLYVAISMDMGKSFLKPYKYSMSIINTINKATFISENESMQSCNIKELFLREQPIPEIFFIPELYPQFYNLNSDIKVIHSAVSNENPNKYLSQINELKKQISILTKENLLLYQTKGLLEKQISTQSIEISELQNSLDTTKLNHPP